jgi:hypothetical protein
MEARVVLPLKQKRLLSIRRRAHMDITTLLVILVLILLLGGGGWYGRGRWY